MFFPLFLMIKITLSDNGFTMEGHAGFAPSGQDIVCAAASVLAINTVNAIEQLTTDRFLLESDEKAGTMRFCFTEEPVSEKGRVLFDALVMGLSEIEKDYGKKYIRIARQGS